jgi:RNA polymerase sigma-70 factor, ECF subfamily
MSKIRRTSSLSWITPETRLRCLREAQRFLPAGEAEDAVQEALLRAWRKPPTWAPPSGLLPWLLMITRNEALRIRARPYMNRTGGLDETVDQASDDRELERLPLRLDVGEFMEALPNEERALLELRYAEDLTSPMIGRRLGVSEGAVRLRLHRLHARLRPVLSVEEA